MNLIKFANLFFLIVLLLSACSSPTAAPTQSAEETSAPTEAAAATKAATELPAATATLADQLQIIESFTWIDALGDYRVEMLVRNPYDHPLWVEDSWTRILDASDQILVSGEIYIGDGSVVGGLGHILPGETIPATSCITCAADGPENREILQGLGDGWADNLTIGFDLEYSLPLPYATDFEVRVDSFSATIIEGAIKYTGTIPVRSAFIRFLFYDQDGHYVGWGEGSVWGEYNEEANNFSPIATGTWLPFSAFPLPTKVEQDLDYEVTVIGNGCFGLISDCQEDFAKATPQN